MTQETHGEFHQYALRLDDRLGEEIRSGQSANYSEALEKLRAEAEPEPVRFAEIVSICDNALGIDQHTQTDGPKMIRTSQLSRSMEVSAFLFDDETMAREYIISEYTEGGRYRLDTILVLFRDGRQAALEEQYQGKPGNDVLLTQRHASDLQLEDLKFALKSAIRK